MATSHLTDKYKKNGYCTLGWSSCRQSIALRSELASLIDAYFGLRVLWDSLEIEAFHEYCLECQDEIRRISFQERFLEIHKRDLLSVTGISSLYHESVVFLRAVRPCSNQKSDDSLGFHRETMYSDSKIQTSKAHNIWIPLTKVSETNAVKYYEGSHKIPDAELEIGYDSTAPRVMKGSAGHKLGNLYSPKTIISALDRRLLRLMMPNKDEYSLFSAMTIHGGGRNEGTEIRLSLSMAVIEASEIEVNKPYIAADGRPHYVSL